MATGQFPGPAQLQDLFLDADFDEFIPVDNFWDQYVSQLNEFQPSQPGSLSQENIRGPQWQDNSGPKAAPLPAAVPPGLSSHTHASIYPDAPPANLFPSANGSATQAPPAPLVATPIVLDTSAAAHQSVLEFSTGANTDHSSEGNNRTTSRRGDVADGGVSKMSKGERQQMLNKAAQQRYRERKKAKALKLEQAVNTLQLKVQELDVVEQEKRALKEKVFALERELVEKDAQLTQLREEASRSTQDSSAEQSCGGGEPQTSNADMSVLVQTFHGYVADVRTFLVTSQLTKDNSQVTLQDLTAEQVAALRSKTEAVLRTCMRIHRLVTQVDTWAMVEASIDTLQSQMTGDEEMWFGLVRRMRLSEDAIGKAHHLRERYLKKLETIYMDRQALNLMAVKLLLPEDVGGTQPTGRAAWFSFKGFFKRHKHNNKVAGVLGRLKANLVAEQRALGELDVLVLSCLLDPLQCALGIVAAYPNHCDVVSLLNAIHHVHPPPAAAT